MEKIVIIGGSGYLGGNLVAHVRKSYRYDVYSTYFSHGQPSQFDIYLDITNKSSVQRTMERIKPSVVVHAAAIADSNYCAQYHDEAWDVNVLGTENVVSTANELGFRLIYISTDQVLSGEEQSSSEDRHPSPISFYGKTKLEAEHLVMSRCRNACVARTSLIYGISKIPKGSFFDTLISNLLEDIPTKLFNDEYRSPIFLDNYCDIIMELINRLDIQGLYNISGNERISRYGLARLVANALFKKESLLIPVAVDDFRFLDGRPSDCSMSNEAITNVISTEVLSIQRASNIIRKQLTTKHRT